jgi:hypothetical protein
MGPSRITERLTTEARRHGDTEKGKGDVGIGVRRDDAVAVLKPVADRLGIRLVRPSEKSPGHGLMQIAASVSKSCRKGTWGFCVP